MEVLSVICAYSVFFLENFIIVYNFMTLTEYKFKNKALGYIWQTFFLLFLDTIRDYGMSRSVNAFVVTFSMFFFMFLLVFIFYKGSIIKKMISLALYYIPAIVGELVSAFILIKISIYRNEAYVKIYPAFYLTPEYRVFGIIFCAQTILCFWGIGVYIWKYIETRIWVKEYMVLIILGIYQELLLVVFFTESSELTDAKVFTGLMFFSLGFLLETGTIYLVNRMVKKIESERKLSRLYRQREKELKYYHDVNEHMEKIRIFRHEYANQLQVIYDLLDNQSEEKAEQMIQMIYENIRKTDV